MLLDSLSQVWPPFVLVCGLLLVGRAASDEGLFEALGARVARGRLSPRLLLAALLVLVALVTAVLNLDTSVVFLTPVLVHAARRRGLDERPFLYGAVFMSNSASLLLPGSNLTNLLVLHGAAVSGTGFARGMLPAWLAACALTVLVLCALVRPSGRSAGGESPRILLGPGAVGVGLSAALVLVLPSPALPVLAVGVAAAFARRRRPRLDLRVLVGLFGLTVGLAVAAHAWAGPARLPAHAGRWQTTLLAALGANLVDNLPASVLLSAHQPAHPRALLVGLDLGPNLAVTGSLSAYLWFQAAKAAGARPSVGVYTRLGLVLAPVTLAAALAAPSG
jgi:arsenical pump membrane protein